MLQDLYICECAKFLSYIYSIQFKFWRLTNISFFKINICVHLIREHIPGLEAHLIYAFIYF